AAALGVEGHTLPAEPLPAPEPGTVDPETSRTVDAARYAFEVIAARSSGEQRAAASQRAGHLADVADAVDPEQDAREVAYDITGSAEAQALATAAELDVLRAYVTLLSVDGGDREAVLAAAVHAAGQVRAWD